VAEQVGSLLWQWRTANGWSLGRLARAAGVSKAALSQWESGKRQPRLPELEATLDALGATSAQRALALSRIDAPRALRQLRAGASEEGLVPPPSAGDLLRAMRHRGGWTQEQIAVRVGVRQHSVARWESGERLPSADEIQAVCFALGAHAEELVALTAGRFSEPTDWPTTWDEAEPHLRARLAHLELQSGLIDLHYLALEHDLWSWATREERARTLLAHAYGHHALFCRNRGSWAEVEPLAQRALSLSPRQEQEPDPILRAILGSAAAVVYGGHRQAPERGVQRLTDWLARSAAQPEMTAWMLSDMAKYLAMEGQTETALTLAQRACHSAAGYHAPIELYLRRYDYGRLLLEAGRAVEALDVLPEPDHAYPYHETEDLLLLAEAHGQAGNPSEAQDWLGRAYDRIEANGLDALRLSADALALHLSAPSAGVVTTPHRRPGRPDHASDHSQDDVLQPNQSVDPIAGL
jgi:transcriptional regulator with XRE-family HTH domain